MSAPLRVLYRPGMARDERRALRVALDHVQCRELDGIFDGPGLPVVLTDAAGEELWGSLTGEGVYVDGEGFVGDLHLWTVERAA